jgi:hypothetical protein
VFLPSHELEKGGTLRLSDQLELGAELDTAPRGIKNNLCVYFLEHRLFFVQYNDTEALCWFIEELVLGLNIFISGLVVYVA